MCKKFLVVVVLIVLLILSGCSSKNQSADTVGSGQESAANTAQPAPATEGKSVPQTTDRKMIQRLYYTVETKTYTETLAHIMKAMELAKGYTESMEQRGTGADEEAGTSRYGLLRLRIPAESLKTFTESFVGDATITGSRLETEDATGQVFDTEAHLKTLTIQESRLLKLLEQSSKLEDMIVLETRLSEVRYEIENLQGTLKRLNQLVAYSVVEIELYEVRDVLKIKPSKNSYVNRALETFMSSVSGLLAFLEGFSLMLIGLIPMLIIVIPLYLGYRWLVKRHPEFKLISRRSTKVSSGNKVTKDTEHPSENGR
jgi:hypothetical protein